MIRPLSLLLAAALCGSAASDSIVLVADRDNTLFGPIESDLSSGASTAIYAGRIANQGGPNNLRRALMHFDVSGIPVGATVTAVSVDVSVIQTPPAAPNNVDFGLHRLESSWGESTSNSAGGAGAFAEDGDATWLFGFYPDQSWSTPGGDFVSAPSASLQVNGNGTYRFEDDGLVADVQRWVDGGDNDGWILIGDVSLAKTVRKFASREYFDSSRRPTLTVEYEQTGIPGDFNGDGFVNGADFGLLLVAWGSCSGCPEDLDDNGVVNGADVGLLLVAWTG